eukprot:scaffold64816_cov95-Phaeocystis_antarctica.AAC.2
MSTPATVAEAPAAARRAVTCAAYRLRIQPCRAPLGGIATCHLVRPPTCPRVRLLAPCAWPAYFCCSPPHLRCAIGEHCLVIATL